MCSERQVRDHLPEMATIHPNRALASVWPSQKTASGANCRSATRGGLVNEPCPLRSPNRRGGNDSSAVECASSLLHWRSRHDDARMFSTQ